MFERILALFDTSMPTTPLPPADAKYALGALMVRTAMADKAYLVPGGRRDRSGVVTDVRAEAS